MTELFLGIDCATQSMRGALIDGSGKIHFTTDCDLAPVLRGADGRLTQDPYSWVRAAQSVISECTRFADSAVAAIAGISISATSGTFVLTDISGTPVAPAAMYNDGRGSSPLARAAAIIKEVGAGEYLFAHTPEFILAALTHRPLATIATDWSHALKTGVDLSARTWSKTAIDTASDLGCTLAPLVAPGSLLGRTIDGDIPIYAGMTDGCTAQISTGSSRIGSAVTTLGTTLVIKIISGADISGPGFYSHLLPEGRWLTGGASNLGGICFAQYRDEIEKWDHKAAAHGPASCVMYPLVGTGERFPLAAPMMQKITSQPPRDDIDEYRATLEAIAFAERLAYETLDRAGAALTAELFTAGGGSRSHLWNSLRATIMQRTIYIAQRSGSDIGAAMIAAAAHHGDDLATGLDSFNSSTQSEVLPNRGEIEIYEAKYQEFLALVQPFQSQKIR